MPLLLLLALLLSPLQLSLNARVIPVDHPIRALIRVTQNEDNRQLVLSWYHYEEFPNKKYYQLDGENAPRSFYATIIPDEDGEWTFRATLVHANASDIVVSTPFTVTP